MAQITDDRYQVRGVPASLQKRVAAAAKAHSLTVSALVVAALEAHLATLETGSVLPEPVLVRLDAVVRQLTATLAGARAHAQHIEDTADKLAGRRPSKRK